MRTILSLCAFFFFFAAADGDDYVNEVQGRCHATNRPYSCTKYKLFKYIDDFQISDFNLTSEVRFITIPGVNASDFKLVEKARQHGWDPEVVKIVKFVKRKAMKFLYEQGVSVELPEGAQIVSGSEDRGVEESRKKKKKMLILPLLILLKLFKIKILLNFALAGIFFIKKILLVAAFVLPGVVAAVKAQCKAQQLHVVPYQVDEDHYTHDHEHVDDDSYGFSSYGGDKPYWDKKRRILFHRR